jgi:hypothetical protein
VQELAAVTCENRGLREAVERGRAQMEAVVQKLKKLQAQHVSNGGSNRELLSNGHHHDADKSGVLIEPLANDDDITRLNGIGNSPIVTLTGGGSGNQKAPIFFDETPLAPAKPSHHDTTEKAAKLPVTGTSSTPKPDKNTHNAAKTTAGYRLGSHSKSKQQFSSPPPPPPNQPEAVVVRGMDLSVLGNERKCPKCSAVFLMLGEREFQSHVARCCPTPPS